MTFTSYTQHPNKAPKHLVVLLHGYGSNSQDLISLAPDLAPYIEDALFVSPNAPFPFEGGLPNSYQWYSLLDRSTNSLLTGYKAAHPILQSFISTQLAQHSLDFSQLILAGFSQGGMMSMQYGLRCVTTPPKAIISFSGYLLAADELYAEVNLVSPVLTTHGALDPVVTLSTHQQTVAKLHSLGVPTTSHLSPSLTHGIDLECLQAAQQFLEKIR